jgi:hypothetical protein
MQTNDAINHRINHVLRPYTFQPEVLKSTFHCLKLKPNKIQRIQVSGDEIISVNQQSIAYPTDSALIKPSDFKHYQGDNYDDADSPVKGEDRCAHIELLCRPIIINLREDNIDTNTQQLTMHEIAYFKQMGQNATLFIHGYNIALGKFPRMVIGIQSIKKVFMENYNCYGLLIDPILNESRRTFYRHGKMILDHFGCSFSNNQPVAFKNYDLNGTGAYEWFLHMEDNLNVATGQFYRNNYLKYTRMIHVTWSGDVGVLNYMAAEDKADIAAKKLIKVIRQLIAHDIEVNVIAHSLGSRILLSVMNDIGQQHKYEIINHVFLWQAAVPNTALSNNVNKDTTIKNNGHFPDAYKAAKKITVLFSRRDKVLKKDYYLANVLGISPEKLNDESALDYLAKRNAKRQLLSNRKLKIYRRLLKHVLKLMLIHQHRGLLFKKLPHANIKHLIEIDHALNKIYSVSGKVTQALGYTGPDMTDKLMQALAKQKKLILADTTEFVAEHSAMKTPTEKIMENVYRKWIVGGSGIKTFGVYQL